MSTSAYKCKHCFGFASQYPIYDSQISYDQNYQTDRQMGARSAENERVRTNERSLPIHSETQRIQDEERRRHNSRVEDPRHRVENGSYKILNNPPKPCVTNRRSQPDSSSNDRVVFPGPSSAQTYIPEIPEECKRIGICDSVPNYPEERVANILSKLEGTKMFQMDELDVSDTPDIAQRLGPQEDNLELCSFREKIIYPRGAPDREGKWYMVVNSKENPVQGFKVEICDNTQSPCAEFAMFQPGYDARCVQKYVRRTMVALDHAGQMTDMALKVPSCCSCVAKVLR